MIIPLESSSLTVSCLCTIWRDFSLYIMLHALPIASWPSKCMHTYTNGLGQKRISIKKFWSLSTYSPTISWEHIPKIIVELAIHVSFEKFPWGCSSSKSKCVSACGFYIIYLWLILSSLYPFYVVWYCYNASHSFKFFLTTPKHYLLSCNKFD